MKNIFFRVPVAGTDGTEWTISFKESEDSNGFEGKATLWFNSLTKDKVYTINIMQSSPLGQIYFYLNMFEHGSAAQGKFNGVSITERDLQWLSFWATEAIERSDPEYMKSVRDGSRWDELYK